MTRWHQNVEKLGIKLGLKRPVILEDLRRHFIVSNDEWAPEIEEAMETILKASNFVVNISLDPHYRVFHYHGDLTALPLGAIVNAGNPSALGCFQEDHKCIDNVIHSKAGPSLRRHCRDYLVRNSLTSVEKGSAFICPGGALPASYVIHTVGPVYPRDQDYKDILRKAYTSCLDLADKHDLTSIGFPCISTGLYGMPSHIAAVIAKTAVTDWLIDNPTSPLSIVFCTFSPKDRVHYV